MPRNLQNKNFRRNLFLLLGLTRAYLPRKKHGSLSEPLSEPEGARACRRNITALSGSLVVVGLAGADFAEMNVFGLKLGSDSRGPLTVSVAIVLVQLYWYAVRYCHMKEDAIIEPGPDMRGEAGQGLKIRLNESFALVQKSANLFANRVAFLLAVVSWFFMVSWSFGA